MANAFRAVRGEQGRRVELGRQANLSGSKFVLQALGADLTRFLLAATFVALTACGQPGGTRSPAQAPFPEPPPVAPAVAVLPSPIAIACEAGDDRACLTLDRAAGGDPVSAVREALRRPGEAEPTDETLRDRCNAKDGAACSALAQRLAGATPPDEPRARGLTRLACAYGYWTACNDLVAHYDDPLGHKVGRQGFERACARGDGAGCYNAALRYLPGLQGLDADIELGTGLLNRSCELGYGTGCYTLAHRQIMASPPMAPEAFVALMRRACEGGSPDACSELKTPRGELEEACEAGDPVACALLGAR